MEWKWLSVEDLDRVMELQSQCHPPELWESPESFARKIASKSSACGALWEGVEIVAYGLSYGLPPGEWPALGLVNVESPLSKGLDNDNGLELDWFLHDIVVHPEYRKRGLAEQVLVYLIHSVRKWNPKLLRGVAVNGSAQHWQKYGMTRVNCELPANYGPKAVALACEMQRCVDFFEAKALQSLK